MNYISTRNNQKNFTFKDVFLKGLAEDGGLFVPKSIKPFKKSQMFRYPSPKTWNLCINKLYPLKMINLDTLILFSSDPLYYIMMR